MPLLRLNEHYNSVQGEGPNTGKLTQFVRFSGCNMRCPGWPCDTQHAIQPELFRLDPKFDSSGLLTKILMNRTATGARHICITGGEPFLQDNVLLKQVILGCIGQGMTIDIFTNGSFNEFPSWITMSEITIVMDWKLPGSGEATTKLEQRFENARKLRAKDAVKFVVKDQDDLDAALGVYADLYDNGAQFWVGRVWDCPLSNDDLIAFIQQWQLPWSLNVQIHKLLWPNVERGI